MILKLTGFLTVLLFAATCIALGALSPAKKLTRFHEGLLDRYPSVEHLSTEDLAKLPETNIVLFDVRDTAEFNVSHLHNATRVPPEMDADAFLQKYRHKLTGKTVVFYCSVGERSSKLAESIINTNNNPTFEIRNLAGGLFKWHNEQRSIVNSNGLTTYIHPFNNYWGRLLVHSELISKQ